MVLLLWRQIVLLWHQVTNVASEQLSCQTIVLPRKLATRSIHDYLFWYCPLVGILFEVLRIVNDIYSRSGATTYTCIVYRSGVMMHLFHLQEVELVTHPNTLMMMIQSDPRLWACLLPMFASLNSVTEYIPCMVLDNCEMVSPIIWDESPYPSTFKYSSCFMNFWWIHRINVIIWSPINRSSDCNTGHLQTVDFSHKDKSGPIR